MATEQSAPALDALDFTAPPARLNPVFVSGGGLEIAPVVVTDDEESGVGAGSR